MTSGAENFPLCKNQLGGLALAPAKTLWPSVFDVRARYLAGIDQIPGSRDDSIPVTKPPRVEDYVTYWLAASLLLNWRRAGLIL